MKNARIICIFWTAIALTLLSSCESVSQTSDSQMETGTPDSSDVTGANSENTSEKETTSGSEALANEEITQSQENISQYADTAYLLMNALNAVDNIGGGNIDFDETDTFTNDAGDRVYAKVADTRFYSTSDIREFMEESLTENMISSRYSAVTDGSDARYIDVDGVLYGNTAARGCGFAWTDTAPVISDVTESSFIAAAEYDDYGAISVLTMKIISDNGTWKIDSIKFPG